MRGRLFGNILRIMKPIYTSASLFGVAADCYLMSCSLWMKTEACRPRLPDMQIYTYITYIYGLRLSYCRPSINCLNVYKYFTARMGVCVRPLSVAIVVGYSRSFSCCRAHWSNQINGRHNAAAPKRTETAETESRRKEKSARRMQKRKLFYGKTTVCAA